MKIGDAFYFSFDIHLWVVISDPSRGDEFVLVSVTTKEPYKDSTCKLHAGDHPKIIHDSLVDYKRARLFTQRDFAKLVQKKAVIPVAPVSAAVLARILDGAGLTRLMPLDCQDLLDDQGLITVSP
jgi:hypothetical protein